MQPRFLKVHYQTRLKLLQSRKDADEDRQYRVARRIHAVLLNADGKTSGQVASLLNAPRSKVSQWLQFYDEYGLEGLLEGQRSGRPSLLDAKQKQTLDDIVESGPRAYGFLSGVWTAIMIQNVIEEEFGVAYDPRHVRRILDELNFTVQRPKRVLARANVAAQNRWRRYTYPNLKKKPKNKKGLFSLKMKHPSAKTPRFTERGHVVGNSL